jgi:glycyl-tRNA synthetase beta chain
MTTLQMNTPNSRNETKALLIELFTEELPPKALARLSHAFAQGISQGLVNAGLATSNDCQEFATPRRLAVRVLNTVMQAADRQVDVKGPSIKVGLDAQGKPTQALVKWAEKQGAAVEQLTQGNDGKQDCFYFKSTLRGLSLEAALTDIISSTLSSLPIPKVMQYQLADGSNVSFVRPAHGLIALWGDVVIPAKALGLSSGRTTHGHRFQGEKNIILSDQSQYESALKDQGHVLASLTVRRELIRSELLQKAIQLNASLGDMPAVETLIDEVNALVEWPAIYAGQFEETFLDVPQECLILSMRTNQKYFPLFDANGKLLPKFFIVSNMTVKDPTLIVNGNERVVRPRLADARFFFEQDKKRSLDSRVPALANVVYHAKLGTQAQRSQRVSAIAVSLATLINALSASSVKIDPVQVSRAAQLGKTDLLTDMVGEFPELQGLMGSYYAAHDGESTEVAAALTEQYQPKFAGDALPASSTGLTLALADKLETLAGMFGIGALPTGDKDPFALRRHALGVVRMLIEKNLSVSLKEVIAQVYAAFAQVPQFNAASSKDLQSFIYDRLTTYLKDGGASQQEIAAVLALSPDVLTQIPSRLSAVKAFAALPEAAALAAANKRIGNILKKSSGEKHATINKALLTPGAETKLATLVEGLAPIVAAALAQNDYKTALLQVAGARATVDGFFADVMVMDEDLSVRSNRLSLLSQVHSLMNKVADISLLAS